MTENLRTCSVWIPGNICYFLLLFTVSFFRGKCDDVLGYECWSGYSKKGITYYSLILHYFN